jgi:hypothetical protein
MTTITEFLLARIAEDEREANVCLAQYHRGEGGSTPRWTRQLAECAAKRAIVEPFAKEWARPARLFDAYLSSMLKLMMNAVIRPMATVYRDHPDFQREWAA